MQYKSFSHIQKKGRNVLGHQFCKIAQQRTTENKTHVKM